MQTWFGHRRRKEKDDLAAAAARQALAAAGGVAGPLGPAAAGALGVSPVAAGAAAAAAAAAARLKAEHSSTAAAAARLTAQQGAAETEEEEEEVEPDAAELARRQEIQVGVQSVGVCQGGGGGRGGAAPIRLGVQVLGCLVGLVVLSRVGISRARGGLSGSVCVGCGVLPSECDPYVAATGTSVTVGTISRRHESPPPLFGHPPAPLQELLVAARASLPVPYREDGPPLGLEFDVVPGQQPCPAGSPAPAQPWLTAACLLVPAAATAVGLSQGPLLQLALGYYCPVSTSVVASQPTALFPACLGSRSYGGAPPPPHPPPRPRSTPPHSTPRPTLPPHTHPPFLPRSPPSAGLSDSGAGRGGKKRKVAGEEEEEELDEDDPDFPSPGGCAAMAGLVGPSPALVGVLPAFGMGGGRRHMRARATACGHGWREQCGTGAVEHACCCRADTHAGPYVHPPTQPPTYTLPGPPTHPPMHVGAKRQRMALTPEERAQLQAAKTAQKAQLQMQAGPAGGWLGFRVVVVRAGPLGRAGGGDSGDENHHPHE